MLDIAYNSKKVIIVSLVALALAATSITFYYVAHATKIARAVTPCPAGKVCGLVPQDGTVLTGNLMIFTGKSNSTATTCGVAGAAQSVVVVSPQGGQAAVLTISANHAEQQPGSRVSIEIEYPNDCADPNTGVAFKQYQGTLK